MGSQIKKWSFLTSGLCGRFATLDDVIAHYDKHFSLQLSDKEKSDLVEYLKSI
jgi:hypothetical protein